MNKKGIHWTKEEIEECLNEILNKSINEIKEERNISTNENKNNKGSIGLFLEQNIFGIPANNKSEPDFVDAKIELKVTPYKKLKNNQLSAKERLVLNDINYANESKNNFENSHFMHKNQTIQLVWYLWEEGKDKNDFKITDQKLLELKELGNDFKQIKNDWEDIIQKIKNGEAENISEGDTSYLGACTKGANSREKVSQPNSPIKAPRRAFCFKTSYMTQLVRRYIGNKNNKQICEQILKTSNTTLINFAKNVTDKYKNLSQAELMKNFAITSNAKNINNIIIRKMFGVKGNLAKTDEFLKAKIIPKTIRIEENGRIKESLSFPAFKYEDIVNQEWETCDLREELETTKYMFFIFKKSDGDYKFKDIKLWNMPEKDIQKLVKKVWEQTRETIKEGNIVKFIDKKGRRKTNFIGVKNNEVCHVRPHARNANDVYKLPVADKVTGATEYTKHCFWINNTYMIKEIFKNYI